MTTQTPTLTTTPDRPPVVPWLPDLILVTVTLIWGLTFLITQTGLQSGGPFAFLGVRFAFAALVLVAVSFRILKGLTLAEVKAGALIGLCIAVGFACQTIGLMTIDTSKSAFLTALYVPLVPLLELVVFRRRLGAATWVGVLMAFLGLVCLSSPGGMTFSMGKGELLTVMCALITAAEILLIGKLTRGTEPRRMAIVQLVVAAAISFAAMGLFAEPMPTPTLGFFACALGLGAASAFIQVAMNWAQKTVSATRATLIYTLEPVWAGLFGRIAGERLSSLGLVGAALILMSVLASVVPWAALRRRDRMT
ncbi:MAG: DMT family transporter [Candidatus Sericytochromatia bacterium]